MAVDITHHRMWSRYTLSIFVDRKKPCHIIDALMKECMGGMFLATTGLSRPPTLNLHFLQGKEIKRDVYINPPKESKTAEGLFWML